MEIRVPEWGELTQASNDNFYGSSARKGLFLDYHDNGIQDVLYDTSNVTVTISGKTVDNSKIDLLNNNKNNIYQKKFNVENLYGTCFHGDFDEIVFTNSQVETGTLLIIGNSYSNPIERFFTESYHQVIVYDPRWNKRSIQDYINQYQPEDVFVLWTCGSLRNKN